MNTTYLRDARERMRRHGVFIQGVTTNTGLDQPYVYTAGFSLLDPPAPEVIVFGLPVPVAGRMISTVFEQVRSGTTSLRPGSVVTFPVAPSNLNLRVDEVLPQWVPSYARVSGHLLDTSEVPRYAQLVWADWQGRWPESGSGHSLLHHQPLLAFDPAWRLPLEHTADQDLWLDQAAGEDRVAMHVLQGGIPEGRFEVLACTRLDDQRVRIGQVPWLVDYVAYGDVVAVRPKLPGEHDAGLDGVFMGGTLLDTSGYDTLSYVLRGRSRSVGERLADVLADLTADPRQARVSTSADTLHVNTRDPEAIRAALRSFVRDGFVSETDLRSVPFTVPPTMDGSCCTDGLAADGRPAS